MINANAVALITQLSPAAWRHILLNGHYTFQSGGKMIDLDALLAGWTWDDGNSWGSGLQPQFPYPLEHHGLA